MYAPATAQDTHYSLKLRGVPLDEALRSFVRVTDAGLTYDANLVAGHRAVCVVEDASAEEVLRCILSESGLIFYRLSSGRYVIRPSLELPPMRGRLAGYVVDSESGEPMLNAHVRLAKSAVAGVTNASGQFAFPSLLPGAYTLTVTHVGYEDWLGIVRVSPGERTHVEARLTSKPILITPVVVEGRRRLLSSRSIGPYETTQEILPVGEAASIPASPFRRLSAIPGVRLHDVTADVYVQGGDQGELAFLLDGAPVFLPRHVIGHIGPFSAYAIDRITVHKAGAGAAQGSHLAGALFAEHALGAGRALDVQLDPISLNTRLSWAERAAEGPDVTLMLATRVGLWDLRRPDRLARLLNTWSAPDPFLVFAPLGRYEDANPGFLDSLPGLRSAPHPELHFTDLHLAGRWRPRPLQTLHASVYHGGYRLGGSLLDPIEAGAFNVYDDYAWRTTTAQVRHETIASGALLFGTQLRSSRYRMEHRYRLLDSLGVIGQGAVLPLASLVATDARDGSFIQEVALSGTLDYVRNRHDLQGGIEAAAVSSAFNIKMPGFNAARGRSIPAGFDVRLHDLEFATRAWRLSALVEDRLWISDRARLNFGARFTYLPSRRSVYAEPRLSMRLDGREGRLGAWGVQVAAGMYRQYVNVLDVGVYNGGALLPTTRVWLPIDRSVRPPRAYHLTGSVLLEPSSSLSMRLEAYVKEQPHRLIQQHLLSDSVLMGGPLRRSEFLVGASRRARGGSASARWTRGGARAEARYDYSFVRQRSPALFNGKSETVPWNVPQRIVLALDWELASALVVSTRWRGEWGRTWGYRQAYYDYFAHHDNLRYQGAYDLAHPSAHRLSPLYQLDLMAAYTPVFDPIELGFRVSLLNVLNRANEMEWRLSYDMGELRRESVPIYGFTPSFAVSMKW